MNRVLSLPPAFDRFGAIGGVLDFAVFEDADGTDEDILSAVPHALRRGGPYDGDRLRALGSRRITERTFFGTWYDDATGRLLRSGRWDTADGRTLIDPPLASLDGVTVRSGGGGRSDGPGQFAYAFVDPPYGLFGKTSFAEVQAVFDAIRAFILPPAHVCEIADWSSERLVEVSGYFEDGLEWWGCFLFSVYVPSLRRLTIIAGSATD